METENVIAVNPAYFILSKRDIPAALQLAGWKPSAISPLSPYVPAAGEAGDKLKELMGDTSFTAALKTLCDPQRMLRVYAGGGMQPRGDLSVCVQPAVKEAPLVALTPSWEDSWVILAFPEAEQGIAWLLDTLACKVESAPEAPLPGLLTPEFLVYLFGSIDQYRRGSYENLLRYRSGDPAPFTIEELATNIRSCLHEKDLRWTLPALAMLMPGFTELSLREDAAVLQALTDADILSPEKGEDGILRFRFGQTGKDLGTEFMRSWVQSAGMEIQAPGTAEPLVEKRAYLAGTWIANHLFEQSPEGFRYAPLDRYGLGEWLENALSAGSGEKPPVEIKAAEEIRPVEKAPEPHCTKCGAAMKSDARFCPSCGWDQQAPAAEAAKTVYCGHCGQPLREGSHFCPSCGNPVTNHQ